MLQLVGMEVGNFSILCRFKIYEDEFCWTFTRVYGPTRRGEREDFWEVLRAINDLWSDP